MKAVVINTYGSPEHLKVVEVQKPAPAEHQVLVRILFTAVNDYDWSMIRGKPILYRLLFGLFKPRTNIPGMELSGVVAETGSNVTAFEVGDEVYGDTSNFGFGTFAEYMAVDEKSLVHKPPKMSFEEAVTIPHAAMLAYQGLVEKGKIKNDQKILLNGGGGGVGTFGVQLAKLYNADVTGVDTGDKLQKMLGIGFDQVTDYKKEDFTRNGIKYDLIVDAKTTRRPISYTRSLVTGGRYVTVGGRLLRLLQIVINKGWISRFHKKHLTVLPLESNKNLDYINELYGVGKIKCVIDGPYALEDSNKAIMRFGEGKHTGKVVIRVAEV